MYCFVVSPAALNACFRYGASNSVYRAEETVSGNITAMLPLPLATMLFRYFIVEKLVLNVASLTVFVLAELTLGNIVTTKLPANATQARALPVLNFIVPQPIRGIIAIDRKSTRLNSS